MVQSTQKLGASFPKHFMWGVGTASYQTEGGASQDGRGPAIWDDFCRRPGATVDGRDGAVAADHYNRWKEDIDLMSDLGVNSYRFSIAWPRVQPASDGTVNPLGLDFYDRMVDRLIERNIKPVGTLFHWDLPAWIQNQGGWLSRETSSRFADYAWIVADRIGDRVQDWFTLVEPYIFLRHSHILGEHAPGLSMSTATALPALHHLLLGHGLATHAVKSECDARIGITNHPSPCEPASNDEADVKATKLFDALRNHAVPDAVIKGTYPDDLQSWDEVDWRFVHDTDLATISAPIEYLGLTYYHPTIVRAPDSEGNEPFAFVAPKDVEFTTMGWPIIPDGLTVMIEGLKARYGEQLPALVITENGCSCEDTKSAEGAVDDPQRSAFLNEHIARLADQIEKSIRIDGYFVWSFLDHFEWDLGYTKRWGIVHVDFETLERTPKSSSAWYALTIADWRASHGS